MIKSAKLSKAPHANVYERITATIIDWLRHGTRPWMPPWKNGRLQVRPLRHNGIAHRGMNTVLLWMAAAENGYRSPFWLSYKRAQELGGQVRRGEKAATVIHASAIEKHEQGDDGEDVEHRIPYMKTFSVFCADRIRVCPIITTEKRGPPIVRR